MFVTSLPEPKVLLTRFLLVHFPFRSLFPVSTSRFLFFFLSSSFLAIALVAKVGAQLSHGPTRRILICANDCGSLYRPHGHYRRLIAGQVRLAQPVEIGMSQHGVIPSKALGVGHFPI